MPIFSKKLLFIITVLCFSLIKDIMANDNISLELKIPKDNSNFQIATTHWLPDYLGKNAVFTSSSGGKDQTNRPDNCTKFVGKNFLEAIPNLHNCDKVNPGFGMTCYVNCRCKSEYNKTSCSEGYKLASPCNDMKTNKVLYKECVQKSCAEGGYQDSCGVNDIPTSVTWGGKICYRCRPATCADGNYEASIPTNKICSSINYKGNSCYKDCRPATCADGGYKSSIPTNNICNNISYKGNTCYIDCRPATCNDGGYESAIPTNQVCENVSYKGNTCYTRCRPATCADGGYESSVPINKICSSISYKGNSCYAYCRFATCSDGGFSSSVPSGKTCTSVNYKGNTCYKNCECLSYVYNQTSECANINCYVSAHNKWDGTKERPGSYCYRSGTPVYITPNCRAYGVSKHSQYPRSCRYQSGAVKYQSCNCDRGLYDRDGSGNCHKDGYSGKRNQVSKTCNDGSGYRCNLCYHSVDGVTVYVSDSHGNIS